MAKRVEYDDQGHPLEEPAVGATIGEAQPASPAPSYDELLEERDHWKQLAGQWVVERDAAYRFIAMTQLAYGTCTSDQEADVFSHIASFAGTWLAQKNWELPAGEKNWQAYFDWED